MSVSNHIRRLCRETIVYWPEPKAAVGGELEYGIPIEIKCFWKDKQENMIDDQGKEIVTRAMVYVLQDLVQHGMLFRGTLNDLTHGDKTLPQQVPEALEIKLFKKTPTLTANPEFNRRAIL